MFIQSCLACLVIGFICAQSHEQNLIGTWSTKSNKTVTGPSFYDPIKDRLIEPLRTGISYSFSADGYYEEAYYRALDNPTNPQCTQGMLQWQHGSYQHLENGSMLLIPIAVDGRQLISNPCRLSSSTYTHYNQTELYERYEAYIDPYHNHMRLNLFRFNGAPLPPMYLVYNSPQMLPTTTLHPLPTSSTMTIPGATGAGDAKAQRRDSKIVLRAAAGGSNVTSQKQACRLFWAGITLTGIGSVLILSSLVHSLVKLM